MGDAPRSGFLDSVLGPRDSVAPVLALRIRWLVVFALGIAALALVWAVTYLEAGLTRLSLLYFGYAALSLGTLATLRLGLPPHAAAHLFVGLAFAAAVSATALTGGLRLTNVTPFFVFVVGSIFLLGRGGLPWAALAILAPLVFQTATWLGVEFIDTVPSSHRAMDSFVTWLWCLLVVFFFVIAFERERMGTVRKLHAASQHKNHFLAILSHELRTPLHVLSNALEMFPEEPDPATRERLATLYRENTYALRQLVDDLLNTAQIERGKLPIRAEDFDLVCLLQNLAEGAAPQASSRGLRFRLDLHPDLPRQVRGDRLRTQQILKNLCGNAFKFTPRGTVELSAVPAGGGEVIFRVTDTGIGIADENRELIFENFFQVDGGLRREHGGAGLGLPIVRDLVGQLGGSIELESRLDEGSTFTVRLPYGAPLGEAHAEPGPRNSQRPPPADTTVLVADDNEDCRWVVQEVLTRRGYRVHTAADGEEALSLWEAHRPCLVFLDVQMPRLDGLETTRCIRELEVETGRDRVPIVAMTGHCSPQDRATCMESGMDGFLAKPFDPGQLDEVLAQVLPVAR